MFIKKLNLEEKLKTSNFDHKPVFTLLFDKCEVFEKTRKSWKEIVYEKISKYQKILYIGETIINDNKETLLNEQKEYLNNYKKIASIYYEELGIILSTEKGFIFSFKSWKNAF